MSVGLSQSQESHRRWSGKELAHKRFGRGCSLFAPSIGGTRSILPATVSGIGELPDGWCDAPLNFRGHGSVCRSVTCQILLSKSSPKDPFVLRYVPGYRRLNLYVYAHTRGSGWLIQPAQPLLFEADYLCLATVIVDRLALGTRGMTGSFQISAGHHSCP